MAKYKIMDASTLFVEDSKAWPEKDWETKELVTNDKGQNKFKLKLMAEEDGRLEHYEFIYWGTENPLEGISAMTPVTVKDVELGVGTYKDQNGAYRKWWNFYCSAVEPMNKKA